MIQRVSTLQHPAHHSHFQVVKGTPMVAEGFWIHRDGYSQDALRGRVP
jgi:hypothetical protein